MRRIALINQKGGVGKTTSAVNLGAALAREGRRVALIDLDPQANLSLHLDRPVQDGEPSIYSVLTGAATIEQALRPTSTPGLSLVPSSIDLSGAELELANAYGRELLLREAIERWESDARAASGAAPADYVLIDCPPSLGLLAVNGLVAAREVLIAVQTEFFALQGMSKLMDVLQVLRRRLNPSLETCSILPCLYDNRLKLAREVLAEVRRYFPGQVFARPIGKNVKLAEAPGYGKTIFEYAPESPGAHDYEAAARELMSKESAHAPASAPAAAPESKTAPPVRATSSAPNAVAESKPTPPSAPNAGADKELANKGLASKEPARGEPPTNGRKPRVLRPRAPAGETKSPAPAPKPADVATPVTPSAPSPTAQADDAAGVPSPERPPARRRGAARVVGDLSLD